MTRTAPAEHAPPTGARTHLPLPLSRTFRLEHAAVRGIAAALGVLPFRTAGALGARLGTLGYAPLGIRRRIVERQIAAALPDHSREEVERIARAAYANLGRTSIEAAISPRRGQDAVLALFDGAEGWEHVEQRLASGAGFLIVSGHLGNWELAGAYVAARGVPLDVVAMHLANPLVDTYVTTTREQLGMRVIHDERAVREVPRAVRSGRAVAMLVDQGAGGLASTWVRFFGRLARTPRGPAVFALRLGVPVLFVTALRQPRGRLRLYVEPVEFELTGTQSDDVERIVEAYTTTLERWVRRYPEQYFWHHRRWKHQEPGTPPELGEPGPAPWE